MKKTRKLILRLLILIMIILIAGYIMFNNAGKKADIYVGDYTPELENLSDGSYTGTYKHPIMGKLADVEFTIFQGTVIHFQFRKLFCTPGYSIEKEITEFILNGNTLSFDALSGATKSSFFAKAAIKKAILQNQAIKTIRK